MTTPRLDFSQPNWPQCPDWTILKMDELVVYWLRAHFADPGNIVFSDLAEAIYRPDDTTGILIESVTHWKPNLTEKRPAVIVKSHEITPLRQGIGADRLQGATKELYSVLFTGSHTAYCIGGESGECKVLATEVYRELIRFAPLVRRKLDLMRVAMTNIGAIAKLEEASENFVIPVTLAMAHWESWEIKPIDASVLRQVNMTIS